MGVTDASGVLTAETRYLPSRTLRPRAVFASGVGEVRLSVGSITQTDFGYTFQRSLPEMGLMDYKARMYDPWLARFIQPDTIIPDLHNPQSLNRFSYVNNRPLVFNDPSGNKQCAQIDGDGKCISEVQFSKKANRYIVRGIDLYSYRSIHQDRSNNCGPWAASSGNSTVTRIVEQEAIDLLDGRDPFGDNAGGIQPSILSQSINNAFGTNTAREINGASLNDIYLSLLSKKTVVVDILATGAGPDYSTSNPNNFAHFAEVIGVDLDRGELYLDNSLMDGGDYWTITEKQFALLSEDPEHRANMQSSGQLDQVNQWILIVDPTRFE